MHISELLAKMRMIISIFASRYGKKLQHLCSSSFQFTRALICCCYRDLLFRISPFFIYIFYFVLLSFAGYGILNSLKPRTASKPKNIDLFFTSVSAATVSSMSTVEMEVFSDSQLIVMTVLMFVGGEAFTSMVGLHLKRSKLIRTWKSEGRVGSVESPSPPMTPRHQLDRSFDDDQIIELDDVITVVESGGIARFASQNDVLSNSYSSSPFIKYDSIKFLGFVVLGYLIVTHILGIASVLAYFYLISSAEDVLRRKGLKTFTFAAFTVVSTFASCGFTPTNENMMVFSKNSGLLLILIPQILLGNTLFPCGLRLLLWVMGKRPSAEYLLKKTTEVGYKHLLPSEYSKLLFVTVLGFIFAGFVFFCGMDWDLEGLNGLNVYRKAVGVMFECVNARHTGETILDLSTVSSAILVFFVFMMYLPPYTSFILIKNEEQNSNESEGSCKKRRIKRVAENLIFSQLTYIVIFVMVICITERKRLERDPVNFSVFNIVFEVVSAYGNVGFSIGYSCERQINKEANCVDKWYGFSGKWSDKGKIILIIVMLFGRLKKFNMNGGQGWHLF